MTSAGIGSGSPLIAGAESSRAEFHDLSDDDFGASNVFDFSNSPDTLQSLDSIGTNEQKLFLNPRDLATDPLLDQPTDFCHDSSSDSASSSKRTGSSASAKTPFPNSDQAMDDGSDRMEWTHPNHASFDHDADDFSFGHQMHPSAPIEPIFDFGDHDDAFMDRSFDFVGPSSSPEPLPTGPHTMSSPQMPAIEANNDAARLRLVDQKEVAVRKTVSRSVALTSDLNHLSFSQQQQQQQQTPMDPSINGNGKTPDSREVSPTTSAMLTSHNSSPAATFPSPPPGIRQELLRADHDSPSWHMPDALSASVHHPTAISLQQPTPRPGPMPLYTNHSFGFYDANCQLRIMPTPLKSRVETQIPIKMILSPLPPGVTKLHLPAHTISKPKLLAKPTPDRSPDMLELHVSLVCTSAMEQPGLRQRALERAARLPQRHLGDTNDDDSSPQNGGDVRICQGCIIRERKRAARKKIKKPEEERMWGLDEDRRVVVFNTQEVKEWQPPTGRSDMAIPARAMQIDAPMRIACYCRHHYEKTGFSVIFTIKDYQDRLVAQAMSNPIMITDDHKTHPVAQHSACQPSTADTVAAPDAARHAAALPTRNGGTAVTKPPKGDAATAPAPSGGSQAAPFKSPTPTSAGTTPIMTTAPLPSRALSRPASPSQNGPMSKKRKASGSRVPNGLAMTRLETAPSPSSQGTAAPLSAAASPFSPNSNSFTAAMETPLLCGPPTPGCNDQVPFYANHRSASMDNIAISRLYSAPASNHASRAPSPNGLRGGIGGPPKQMSQAVIGSLYTLAMGTNQAARPSPVIHKIIPNEGPKIGGIEVTVLGQAFFQGLEVWFGDQKATTTTYWGDSSLVCLLPPSPVAGPVAVTFRPQGIAGAQGFPMIKEPPIFKYVDDDEDKLIRTALSVLGHKMSGQLVDVSDLARRILSDGSSTWSVAAASSTPGGPGFRHNSHEHLETQLLKCLDLIDLDDSTHRTRLDLKRATGHTMLHLACSLGYYRFVAALLARGANPDARDRGGFTPLHMAALHGHAEIVRRLMLAGADPTTRTLSSLTAADVASSRHVLRAIRQSGRRAQSFSGGSRRSRTCSSTSLRSLCEAGDMATLGYGPMAVADAGEESPEYTSGDLEDEESEEDMYPNGEARRPRQARDGAAASTDDDNDDDDDGDDDDDDDDDGDDDDDDGVNEESSGGDKADVGTASWLTTQFAAALKEQFQQQLQQFQQAMTLHLQSLPQIGQMPDYQAYLPQAAFMRRMQQLMAASLGTRSEARNGDAAKMDGRWWDLSSYMQNSAAAAPPPPSYEDIFGGGDGDEYRAEAKSVSTPRRGKLFAPLDEDKAAAPPPPGRPSPDVLQIGRKNAITKEQQQLFLRAHERKLKKLSSDRNLFFIWVRCVAIPPLPPNLSHTPSFLFHLFCLQEQQHQKLTRAATGQIPLLLLMVCALLYSYVPALFHLLFSSARAALQAGRSRVRLLAVGPGRDRG